MVAVQLSSLALEPIPTAPRVQLSSLTFDGAVVVGGRIQMSSLQLTGAVQLTLAAVTPATVAVEPYAVVTLTATKPSAAPQPDSYVWRVVSGDAIVIPGTGPTVTIVAPAGLTGTSTVVGVRGIIGPNSSNEVTATITTPPHQYWILNPDGVTWRPVAPPVRFTTDGPGVGGPTTPTPDPQPTPGTYTSAYQANY